MLILQKSIHYEFFKSNILSCHRVLVCLFNKMCIKLLKSADSVKVKLTVNLNNQYARVKFITDLKS